MIEAKFIEWMNMELDGVLPERDRARLREYLSSDPEAASYFERLRATLAVVDSVEQVEPPAGLHERIVDAVPAGRDRRADGATQATSWRGKWFFLPRFRYAAVFAFGVVFGVLVFTAVNQETGRGGGAVDISDFLGTMRQITSEDGFKQTGAFGVDLERVHGSVSLHESNEVLLAEVALEPSEEIDWVVEYEAGDVSFDGYRSFNGGSGRVTAGRTQMRVHQSGDARYLLFFTRKARREAVAPLVVKIFSADQLLVEQPLSPAAKSAD